MLNPNNKKDRLYYGNILEAPANYQLDFAIATTYSLDFDALISTSISLSSFDNLGSDLVSNPISILGSLRETSDKIAIFCENGQIKSPNNVNPLYMLLENMVFQVKMSKKLKNRFASFHPKFWLLRFINDDKNVLYRIIVLSRNLTLDRNWDISFTMEGYKENELNNSKNEPLKSFIDYLTGFLQDDVKKEKMFNIINELDRIDFKLNSNIFDEYEFFINGINNEYSIINSNLFQDNSIDELMIMSPFLSKTVIKGFNNRKTNNSKALLFTRINSIGPLKEDDCNNFEVYALRDEVFNGEASFSEEVSDINKQDLHAKIYVVENEKFTEIYLGSFNASDNALYGNVEFMIKLKAKKSKLSIEKLSNDLFNGEKGGMKDPFQLITVDDVVDEINEGDKLESVMKYVSRLDSEANILINDDSYNVSVEFFDLDEMELNGFNVNINPLLLPNKSANFSKKITFNNLNKLNLSVFYIISVSDDLGNKLEKVVKIPTKGMPKNRHEDVIADIITDENSFMEYVALLLGDDYIFSLKNDYRVVNGKGSSIILQDLYEKMLKASCYSHDKFKEIKSIIDSITSDNVIPDGFEEMYNTFLEVIDFDE
ncbi:MAG: hypothetical protein E7Z78_08745 [Methanobrevibacter thaueri]|uniref:hypothetical protein n=1 Tax=Methanobrevibacter thaueri TaxID=190975 RepID=UPI0026F0DB7C|nr:hypothetical protein [Methanobrevibacter thaueri]MBE6496514.1 hypothetical protein [Methanobrevibacter thaueri]